MFDLYLIWHQEYDFLDSISSCARFYIPVLVGIPATTHYLCGGEFIYAHEEMLENLYVPETYSRVMS